MSEQAREAERRLLREHPPEKCMICSLPAPDSDDWEGHHERIATLERQLAEAQVAYRATSTMLGEVAIERDDLQARVAVAEQQIKRLKVLRGGASRDLEEAKKRLNNLHHNHISHHEEHHVQVGELEDERDEFRALAERRKEALAKYGKHSLRCRYGQLPPGVTRKWFSRLENERLEVASIKECVCGLRAAIKEKP